MLVSSLLDMSRRDIIKAPEKLYDVMNQKVLTRDTPSTRLGDYVK